MTPRLATVALVLVATSGCGLEVGPPGEWLPASSIDGELAPESGSQRQPLSVPAAGEATLRVVTYNVHLGEDPSALADEIRADPALALADVFLLQEEEAYPAEGESRTSRLANLLDLGWSYIPARVKGGGTHGLAILSRFPIDEAEVMTLPATEDWKRRIAIRAEILVGGRRVPVVDLHLETRINITDRILQIRPAVIDLPEAVIVGGDMNTNPFVWEEGEVPLVPTAQVVDTDQAPVLDDYMRQIGFDTPAADVGPTHHVLGVDSRLDAIFTRGFEVTPASVERGLTSSDHWPVWLDVTLP